MATPISVVYGESSFLRICPFTVDPVTTTVVTALGTKTDILHAIKATPTHVGLASASSEAKWNTTDLANGNQLSVPDNSKNVNVFTGEAISDNADASTGKIECSIIYDSTIRTKLIGFFEAGTPVIGIREIGKRSDTGLSAGYEYIIGTITDLKDNPQKGPSSMDFSITGQTFGAGGKFTFKETTPGTPDVDMADVNSAVTGGTNTLTPYEDGGVRTFPALVEADWTKLKQGKIAIKDAA